MIPSLGRIGLFKGKMITLCERFTNVLMISHDTSTEEQFEVITFVENTFFRKQLDWEGLDQKESKGGRYRI